MKDEDRLVRLFWVLIGGVGAVVLGAAMVPLRNTLSSADVALAFVVFVVVVAVAGGREAGAAAALLSALSFDFFFTKPYLHLRIATREDIVTTILLLVVGLTVGQVAALGRRARSSAEKSSGEVRRIYRVAELAAHGDDASDVIMGAQAELTALLQLRECRFEAATFDSTYERLERGGTVSGSDHRSRDSLFELPSHGVELPVLGRGQVLGRFILKPTPGTGVSLEQRVVAVAIADQVGAVLAAPTPGEKG